MRQIFYKAKTAEIPPSGGADSVVIGSDKPALAFDYADGAVWTNEYPLDFNAQNIRLKLYVSSEDSGNFYFIAGIDRREFGDDQTQNSYGTIINVSGILYEPNKLNFGYGIFSSGDLDNVQPGDMFRLALQRNTGNNDLSSSIHVYGVSLECLG